MKNILLNTLKGGSFDRPPVWLMRQAGRILPEYRAIRSTVSSFKALVQNSTLAAEVTLQPVTILGVDAAIIFSDILVIPDALGLQFDIVEEVGPVFEKTIQQKSDIDALLGSEEAASKLRYVYEALSLVRQKLSNDKDLIGFAGAPWTVVAYMIEGKGSKTFDRAKSFLLNENLLSHQLLQKVTSATIAYLHEQVKAGASVLQVFDSWAGFLSPSMYHEFGLPYIKQIVEAFNETPIIVFAKGAWYALSEINELTCQAVSLDWTITPDFARKYVPHKVLQGNMDPSILLTNEETIVSATMKMLDEFGPNHIANLGHGLLPVTPKNHVKLFVDTVKGYSYKSKLPLKANR